MRKIKDFIKSISYCYLKVVRGKMFLYSNSGNTNFLSIYPQSCTQGITSNKLKGKLRKELNKKQNNINYEGSLA